MDQLSNTLVDTLGQVSQKDAIAMLAGVASFGSTLALSTWSQGRLLGISTGSPRPLPTMAGMATVCAASLLSHQVAIATRRSQDSGKVPSLDLWEPKKRAVFGFREDYLNLGVVRVPLHTVRICVVGLLAFKFLGGRFWALAPSSYTHLGSFARPSLSLPATERYANPTQRAAIEHMGRRYGCHTCGSKMRGTAQGLPRFAADHMPPRSVADQMNQQWGRRLFNNKVVFRFFPQCMVCSSKQGGILAKATSSMEPAKRAFWQSRGPSLHSAGGGAQAHFHGFKPRVNHLAGAVIAAAATVGANQADLVDENRWRYARLHRKVDGWVQGSIKRLQRSFS